MSVSREAYRRLLARNKYNEAIIARHLPNNEALTGLGRRTVFRAWVGTWSPWLAGMISAWRGWNLDHRMKKGRRGS